MGKRVCKIGSDGEDWVRHWVVLWLVEPKIRGKQVENQRNWGNDEGGVRKRENGRVNQVKNGRKLAQNAGYRMFHSIYNVKVGHQVTHEAPPGQHECELRFLVSRVSDKSDVQDPSLIFC